MNLLRAPKRNLVTIALIVFSGVVLFADLDSTRQTNDSTVAPSLRGAIARALNAFRRDENQVAFDNRRLSEADIQLYYDAECPSPSSTGYDECVAAVKAKNALVTNAEKRVREVCGSTNYNYVTIFVDEAKAFVTGRDGEGMVHYHCPWVYETEAGIETTLTLGPWDCHIEGGNALTFEACCQFIKNSVTSSPDINGKEIECYAQAPEVADPSKVILVMEEDKVATPPVVFESTTTAHYVV